MVAAAYHGATAAYMRLHTRNWNDKSEVRWNDKSEVRWIR